jgi:hypothetical protein
MENIIVLTNLDKKPWSGVEQYRNCHTDIATYFLANGSRYTGLTKEDEERLCKLIGQSDLSPSSKYWDTFFIRKTNDDIVLNIEDPFDELKYLFLRNHKNVQKSLTEKKATAEYVMVNETAEATETNKRSKLKRRAAKEFDKLSATDIRKALRLYGYKADSMSSEQAEAKLYELVEDEPQRFIDMWVDNADRETQFLIEASMSKNIIRKSKNAYMYGTTTLGHTLEETISFLDDKKNSDLKRVILDETNIK